MEKCLIELVRYSLIALAICALPFYGLWVFGGHLADKRGQRLANENAEDVDAV